MSNMIDVSTVQGQVIMMIANAALHGRSDLINASDRARQRQLIIDYECRYPESLTLGDYQRLWSRFGMARRVVSLAPEECWADDPDVYETNDPTETPWEAELKAIVEKQQLWSHLEEADILSGVGCFAVVLFGINDGLELSQPAYLEPRPQDPNAEPVESVELGPLREITYIKVFPEGDGDQKTAGEVFNRGTAKIKEVEVDPTSPRYGKPVMYTITYPTQESKDVHYTRCLHVSEVEQSRLHAVFNDLFDAKKVGGGSAEMYYKGAFPGISFEMLPEAVKEGMEIDGDGIREEFMKYQEGLQRFLSVAGLKANVLATQVVDPTPQMSGITRRISLALGCPTRVFEGTEQGVLAGDQDGKRWNKKMNRRRLRYLLPNSVRATVDKLMLLRVLSPVSEYNAEWVDLNAATDKEKAIEAKDIVEILARFLQGGVDGIIGPEFLFANILKWPADMVKQATEEFEELRRTMLDEMGDDHLDDDGDPVDDEGFSSTTSSSTTTTPMPTSRRKRKTDE